MDLVIAAGRGGLALADFEHQQLVMMRALPLDAHPMPYARQVIGSVLG